MKTVALKGRLSLPERTFVRKSLQQGVQWTSWALAEFDPTKIESPIPIKAAMELTKSIQC